MPRVKKKKSSKARIKRCDLRLPWRAAEPLSLLLKHSAAGSVHSAGAVRKTAAGTWEKKPGLISCGLEFPAGTSTEKGGGGRHLWLVEITQNCFTPTTSLCPHLCACLCYTVFCFCPPLAVPVASSFSSSSECLFLHAHNSIKLPIKLPFGPVTQMIKVLIKPGAKVLQHPCEWARQEQSLNLCAVTVERPKLPFASWLPDTTLASCASAESRVPVPVTLAALACRKCVLHSLCEICISWEVFRAWRWKITPAAGTCANTHTCHAFLCLLLHERLSDTLWLLPSLFWKKTPGSWQLTWPQYICFNAGKRCGRCVLRGPSLAVGDPNPVHHVATEQLRRISILRSTEWGRVFSGMFFSSHSDSQALSLEHPQERSFFFLFTCQSHFHVSSLSDLALPSAARRSPLAPNCHRAYLAQANCHTARKKPPSYFHRKKLPPLFTCC